MVPGTHARRDASASSHKVAGILRQAAAGRATSIAARFVGNGRVTAHAQGGQRDETERRVRARLAPEAGRDPRRARDRSARSTAGARAGRDMTVMLGGDDPEAAQRDRAQARRADVEGLKGVVAPRVAGRSATARDRHPAAARSRRQSRRDHRGAVQRDPHRDPGRHRPEQARNSRYRTARCRSASRSTQDASRRSCRRSRTCRCRPRAADRCRCRLVADIGFGAGPTQDPARSTCSAARSSAPTSASIPRPASRSCRAKR